ncbi:MAG: DUF2065 domain-containing protein [Acidimicrobiales bacterium]|nr:DUF2065 domain-containing protein [Hyphomonadaceae bacterium]RZV43416.1 MAG: DUF2065 domain-containing protein [Acidimicrobiales bacterium]
MPNWVTILVIAIGGAMLLEGAMYALFPGPMKKAMQEVQNVPESMLRAVGIGIAAFGVMIVYFLMPR